MPKAMKTQTTIARLAMGTALLTVISGCENRAATGYSDLVSLPTPTVAPVPTVAPAPVTTIVLATPAYVAPGAPTYTESSQAANVQAFESVYGPPLADVASGTVVSETPYTLPSYNDGAVTAQPLLAPVATAEPIAAATYASTVPVSDAPMSYAVDGAITQGLVYGETLTSSSYTVASAEPMAAPAPAAATTVIEQAAYAAPELGMEMQPEMQSVSLDSYLIGDAPALDAMPAPAPTFGPAPAPAPMFGPAPAEAPALSVGFDQGAFVDAASDAAPTSYIDALPVTDAAAVASQQFTVITPTVTAPAVAQQSASYSGGVEIIDNDQAALIYDTSPMPAEPAMIGDQSAMMPELGEMASLSVETYALAASTPQVTTPAVAVETSPVPRPKTYVTSEPVAPAIMAAPVVTVATIDPSPSMAPLPRPRPVAEVVVAAIEPDYPSFTTPLPQPRPDFKAPMATATTSGKYVSIGALPDASKPAAIMPEAPAVEAPAVIPEPIQQASIRTEDVTSVDMPLGTPEDLSGTSWRLVQIGAEAVSVNAELHFDDSSAFAGGQGPCNSYGGEFMNMGPGRFSMENIFATKVACSGIDIEGAYIDALRVADRYETAADFNGLTLLGPEGEAVARFKAF